MSHNAVIVGEALKGENMKEYDYAKCAKYFRYMLLLVIPRIIVGLLTNERIMGGGTAVKTVGLILRIIISLVNSYFIYSLSTEDYRYKKAAILSVCIAVLNAAINLISAENTALRIVISMAGLAVSVFYAINFYSANGDVLSQPDPVLSERWNLIKNLYMVSAALTCVSMLIIFAVPVFALIIILVSVIMTLVVYVMELIAFSRSSKACSLYVEASLNRMEKKLH